MGKMKLDKNKVVAKKHANRISLRNIFRRRCLFQRSAKKN